MAYVNSVNTTPRILARLAAKWEDVKHSFELRRNYVETREELNALTDADLADLGITRFQIETIAREAVYGK